MKHGNFCTCSASSPRPLRGLLAESKRIYPASALILKLKPATDGFDQGDKAQSHRAQTLRIPAPRICEGVA
jgi:hypothetical protein